jgi:hypothetical protein
MHTCERCMRVKDACLWEMYAYKRCMPVTDTCMSEIYACKRYIPVKDACLWETHACERLMPVGDVCLWEMYACERCTLMTDACLWEIYTCESLRDHACERRTLIRDICLWEMYDYKGCMPIRGAWRVPSPSDNSIEGTYKTEVNVSFELSEVYVGPLIRLWWRTFLEFRNLGFGPFCHSTPPHWLGFSSVILQWVTRVWDESYSIAL